MKIYKNLCLFVSAIVCLIACGGSDDNNGNSWPNIPDSDKNFSVVGTWEKDNYFLSLSSDGFYVTYLGDNFIDSGTYAYSSTENKLVCNNPYFNRTTTYSVTMTDKNTMKIAGTVTTIKGIKTNVYKSISFSKSTKQPTLKNNPLVGRSMKHTYYNYGKKKYYDVNRTYMSYNSGSKTSTLDTEAKYPLRMFYITYDNRIYEQYFYDGTMPSIGGWFANDGDVTLLHYTLTNGKLEYTDSEVLE